MRRLGVMVLVLSCFGLACQPAARADSSLASVQFNVNGAVQTDYTGFNVAGFNQTTGIGTLTYIFNPGVTGTYNFTTFFDSQISPDFWNEFGGSSGSPAAGQSWEIGDSFLSTIYADAGAGTLTNTNMLPGQKDNFLLSCGGGPTCNGDAALGMGFLFNLTNTQEAVISLNFSTTQPGGGFFLSQTHPIDAGHDTASTIYFTGSEVTRTADGGGPPPVPEPSTLLLLGAGLVGLCLTKMRR
jgi:hypothetical protein